jgi:hypothetical protein
MLRCALHDDFVRCTQRKQSFGKKNVSPKVIGYVGRASVAYTFA